MHQCVLGATSYNGQRCTAIKLIMVHESVADAFVAKLVARVAALKVGLPWESGVAITPLPEEKKPAFLEALIADALGYRLHFPAARPPHLPRLPASPRSASVTPPRQCKR